MNTTVRQLEDMIEVIARMIPKERQSQNIYRETAEWAPSETTRLLFERLAQDEERHETKLRAVMKLLQNELAAARKGSGS